MLQGKDGESFDIFIFIYSFIFYFCENLHISERNSRFGADVMELTAG